MTNDKEIFLLENHKGEKKIFFFLLVTFIRRKKIEFVSPGHVQN